VDGGGYASTNYAFNTGGGAGGTSAVIFRAQDEFNSSGNAFVGDWIADKITKLSVQVRHNAPMPLSYFSRFSGPGNFPGATAIQFAPVMPNTWTTLTFNITPTSPQFVTFEGMDFTSVFKNIGHIQLGVSIPAALANDTTLYKYDIDGVSAVPEPASIGLAALALGLLATYRRRSC
jgi:MYXO-CTERM domain-containing protein